MPKKTILIVDDEPELLYFYEMALEEDFNIITLSNPLEVIPLLNDIAVDLIVSDITMPQMSGRDLIKAVKYQYPHIKAMGVSANYYDPDIYYMFDAYLQKPLIGISALVEKINDLL